MNDRALAEINPALVEDLVDANRILYHFGVVDVSAMSAHAIRAMLRAFSSHAAWRPRW